MSPLQEFEDELKLFRAEVDSALQCLYTFLALNLEGTRRRPVYRVLNRTAQFWNTVLASLQTTVFIVMGRIFDQNCPHNIDRLLKLAQRHIHLFSLAELAKRKQGPASPPPRWLPDYLASAYVPKPADFRKLRAHVAKWRKTYESAYRDLRHRHYAHKEVIDDAEVAALFAKTNIREMCLMLAFLASLQRALQNLLLNGGKPVLRPVRFSVQAIKRRRFTLTHTAGVPERAALDTWAVLDALLKSPPKSLARRRPKPPGWRPRVKALKSRP